MRKNKAFLFISIILIIAMVAACAVGCNGRDDEGDTNVDAGLTGETVVQNNVDIGVSFAVVADADVADIESKIQVVKMATNEVVDSPVVESKEIQSLSARGVLRDGANLQDFPFGQIFEI